MQTKKLSCTMCLMTHSMAAGKAVPASSLTKQKTKQPTVSGKRHTYSLNMVWTESSVPFCNKLSVHAQHKLLVSCIVRSFSTSLLVLYGYIKCCSRKKRLNLTTGRLRGWVGRGGGVSSVKFGSLFNLLKHEILNQFYKTSLSGFFKFTASLSHVIYYYYIASNSAFSALPH